jgi:hypothetical protein
VKSRRQPFDSGMLIVGKLKVFFSSSFRGEEKKTGASSAGVTGTNDTPQRAALAAIEDIHLNSKLPLAHVG